MPSIFSFSAPSKNFVIGEYAVLHGGTALLFTHQPCFTLSAKEGRTRLSDIHPESPGGQFYKKNNLVFKNFFIEFHDPYHGLGGLGASSAQFLLLFTLYHHLQKTTFTLAALLAAYHQYAWNGEGQKPSGADIISQYVGGFIAWHPNTKTTTSLSWPFENLEFHFIHTQHKTATHEHLKILQQDYSFDALKLVAETAFDALQAENSIAFCNAINLYANLLKQHNLTAPNTLSLLSSLKEKHPFVKAAKGCGALGSDVLFVVTEKNSKALLDAWIKTNKLLYL